MGFDSPVHWLIVIAVVALLFGGSRIGNVMGELGKGIKAFKQNVSDPEPARASLPANPAPLNSTPPLVQTRMADGVPPAETPIRQPAPVRQPDQVSHTDQTGS